MQTLRSYINSLDAAEREAFAARCNTTIGYLRKAISCGEKIRAELAIDIDRESSGAVPCESIRPDVDFAYLKSREAV